MREGARLAHREPELAREIGDLLLVNGDLKIIDGMPEVDDPRRTALQPDVAAAAPIMQIPPTRPSASTLPETEFAIFGS